MGYTYAELGPSKMPRTSAAAKLITPRLNREKPRVEPPEHLSDEERTEFIAIVSNCSAEHFTKSDLPLLSSYVGAIVLARNALKDAAHDKDALIIWEKATRLVAMMATRLRLSPQARTDPAKIARNLPKPYLRRPWED